MDEHRLQSLLLFTLVVFPVVILPQKTEERSAAIITTETHFTLSTASRRSIRYAAVVKNLSVRTILFQPVPRFLQLSVSWDIPSGSGIISPKGYVLSILPNNDSSCPQEPGYCPSDNFIYQVIYDPNTTNIIVPDKPERHDVLKIVTECCYNVTVWSTPHNGSTLAFLNYTVPECTGDVCSCSERHRPPNTRVTSATVQTNATVNVTWELLHNDSRTSNITTFIVRFGPVAMRSSANKPVFNISHVQNVSADLSMKGSEFSTILYVPDMTNTQYKVEVIARNRRGCSSQPAEYIFLKEDHKEEEKSHDQQLWWLMIVLPITLSVLVVGVALVIWQRCGTWLRWKWNGSALQPVRTWRGVYKAVSVDSGGSGRMSRSLPPKLERNIIYVEQEIEDAQSRGVADSFEVSYNRLAIQREIGKGAFGRVFLARVEAIGGIPGYSDVAVKKLKNKAGPDKMEEFLSEIAMLKRVGRHPNIVRMLGCCTLKHPYCMLMEYVPCGDLLQYLRRLRREYERRTGGVAPFTSRATQPAPNYIDLLLSSDSDGSYIQPEVQPGGHTSISNRSGRPSLSDIESNISGHILAQAAVRQPSLEYILDPMELQNFALQIAKGMSHLEKKQITHRDLAARNILIDENKTLKISDFGLSRSGIYINSRHKKFPLRWVSVEAIRDKLYSSKSDVWSFAIVLWEIGTLGGFPYPTVDDHDVLSFLLEGNRLEKPDNCTDELYTLMLRCWAHCADDRPSFVELVSYLDSIICHKRVYVDFNSLRPDYTFPPTEEETLARQRHRHQLKFGRSQAQAVQ